MTMPPDRALREGGHFDKIVICTHGQSALTHPLLGSVASDVIRLSDMR